MMALPVIEHAIVSSEMALGGLGSGEHGHIIGGTNIQRGFYLSQKHA